MPEGAEGHNRGTGAGDDCGRLSNGKRRVTAPFADQEFCEGAALLACGQFTRGI
jgi:hypothetical protein